MEASFTRVVIDNVLFNVSVSTNKMLRNKPDLQFVAADDVADEYVTGSIFRNSKSPSIERRPKIAWRIPLSPQQHTILAMNISHPRLRKSLRFSLPQIGTMLGNSSENRRFQFDRSRKQDVFFELNVCANIRFNLPQ